MGETKPIWARQPDEPARWYGRFELYRIMGPSRSLDGAFRLAAQLTGLKSSHPSAHWRRMAEQWNWAGRAAAWDASQSPDAHADVAATVDELLDGVIQALRGADLKAMSMEEARQRLPTLRLFLRDLLAAHRDEEARARDGQTVPPFTADELRAAQGDLARWREQWEDAEAFAPAPAPAPGPPVDEARRQAPHSVAGQALRDVLATLYPDEVSVRRVVSQARLDGARIGFSPRAVDTWHAVLHEAAQSGRLEALMDVAASEYRHHRALRQAVTEMRRALQAEQGVGYEP